MAVFRSEVAQWALWRRCIEADHICELNWPGSVFPAHAAASGCSSVTEEFVSDRVTISFVCKL